MSQKHRRSIYSSLAPVIGEEEVDALLSQFPTRIGDEPVTRDVLRAEMAELRTELHDQMRLMAMWVVGAIIAAMLGGMGVAAGIGSTLA